jgi:hypothetical protein
MFLGCYNNVPKFVTKVHIRMANSVSKGSFHFLTQKIIFHFLSSKMFFVWISYQEYGAKCTSSFLLKIAAHLMENSNLLWIFKVSGWFPPFKRLVVDFIGSRWNLNYMCVIVRSNNFLKFIFRTEVVITLEIHWELWRIQSRCINDHDDSFNHIFNTTRMGIYGEMII